VDLEAERGGPEVEPPSLQMHLQRGHHDLVEGIDPGDIGGGLGGGGHEDPVAVGSRPHQIVEPADGRAPPGADHEPVAGGESGAGDVAYECVPALARSRFRLLDATPQMAAANATDTMARTEWTALKPVERVSSVRMLRRRVTQMNTVHTAAERRTSVSARVTGPP